MNKKIIITIIVFLLLIGGIFIFVNQNKSFEEKLKDIGYSDKEAKEISNLVSEEDENIILNNEYNDDLINILNSKNYKDDNLKLYLEYASNNKKADTNAIINIVNLDLTDYEYSDFLGELASQKYFIKSNLDRYLKHNNDDAEETVSEVNCNLDYDYYENTKETNTDDDNLMLVNKYYYLTEDYEPDDLVTLDSTYNMGTNNQMRKVAADAFMKMADAARLDNITIKNASGYRSYEYQVTLYNDYVKRDGKQAADTYSARAGYSEHQTGLVSDINQIEDAFENTDAFKWLSENSYKYGFILRFPKDKENLTGYKYEPWHYRYVGTEAAKIIHDEDLTLEEYYAYYIQND